MTDSEALTEARVREIMDGCAGVTPGPWEAKTFQVQAPRETICHAGYGFRPPMRSDVSVKIAAHIARLDPDTVRALCTLALSALGTAPAEPVAFIVHDDPELGDYLTKSREAADRSGKRVTPLYASPAPATAAAEIRAEPALCYDPDDWEYTCQWSDRADLAGELYVGQVREIACLAELPPRYAAHVVLTVDDAGDPDETEIQWFESKEAAEAAAKARPALSEAAANGK